MSGGYRGKFPNESNQMNGASTGARRATQPIYVPKGPRTHQDTTPAAQPPTSQPSFPAANSFGKPSQNHANFPNGGLTSAFHRSSHGLDAAIGGVSELPSKTKSRPNDKGRSTHSSRNGSDRRPTGRGRREDAGDSSADGFGSRADGHQKKSVGSQQGQNRHRDGNSGGHRGGGSRETGRDARSKKEKRKEQRSQKKAKGYEADYDAESSGADHGGYRGLQMDDANTDNKPHCGWCGGSHKGMCFVRYTELRPGSGKDLRVKSLCDTCTKEHKGLCHVKYPELKSGNMQVNTGMGSGGLPPRPVHSDAMEINRNLDLEQDRRAHYGFIGDYPVTGAATDDRPHATAHESTTPHAAPTNQKPTSAPEFRPPADNGDGGERMAQHISIELSKVLSSTLRDRAVRHPNNRYDHDGDHLMESDHEGVVVNGAVTVINISGVTIHVSSSTSPAVTPQHTAATSSASDTRTSNTFLPHQFIGQKDTASQREDDVASRGEVETNAPSHLPRANDASIINARLEDAVLFAKLDFPRYAPETRCRIGNIDVWLERFEQWETSILESMQEGLSESQSRQLAVIHDIRGSLTFQKKKLEQRLRDHVAENERERAEKKAKADATRMTNTAVQAVPPTVSSLSSSKRPLEESDDAGSSPKKQRVAVLGDAQNVQQSGPALEPSVHTIPSLSGPAAESVKELQAQGSPHPIDVAQNDRTLETPISIFNSQVDSTPQAQQPVSYEARVRATVPLPSPVSLPITTSTAQLTDQVGWSEPQALNGTHNAPIEHEVSEMLSKQRGHDELDAERARHQTTARAEAEQRQANERALLDREIEERWRADQDGIKRATSKKHARDGDISDSDSPISTKSARSSIDDDISSRRSSSLETSFEAPIAAASPIPQHQGHKRKYENDEDLSESARVYLEARMAEVKERFDEIHHPVQPSSPSPPSSRQHANKPRSRRISSSKWFESSGNPIDWSSQSPAVAPTRKRGHEEDEETAKAISSTKRSRTGTPVSRQARCPLRGFKLDIVVDAFAWLANMLGTSVPTQALVDEVPAPDVPGAFPQETSSEPESALEPELNFDIIASERPYPPRRRPARHHGSGSGSMTPQDTNPSPFRYRLDMATTSYEALNRFSDGNTNSPFVRRTTRATNRRYSPYPS